MGTDCRMVIEIQNKTGKWNFYDSIDVERHYDVFAMLANVRNGSGFAGCVTGDGFIPISEPKGYPSNMDKISMSKLFGEYAHSASWITLKELKDYNWDLTTCHYGVMSEAQYIKFKTTNKPPTEYYGSVMARDIVTVDESTMDKILNDNIDRNTFIKYYVHCKFNPMSYRECAGQLVEEIIPKMEKIIVNNDLSDTGIRIIFDFDC